MLAITQWHLSKFDSNVLGFPSAAAVFDMLRTVPTELDGACLQHPMPGKLSFIVHKSPNDERQRCRMHQLFEVKRSASRTPLERPISRSKVSKPFSSLAE